MKKILSFALILLDQSLEGLAMKDKSRYFLPIFIISLIHRMTVDLMAFEAACISIKNKFPHLTEEEVEFKARRVVPIFFIPKIEDETKKGGFHTIKRVHKRSRRVRRKNNRASRLSGRSYNIRNRYGVRSRRFRRSYVL